MLAYVSSLNIYMQLALQAEESTGYLGWIFLSIILFGILFMLGLWMGRRQLLPKIERAQRELERVKDSKAANERLIAKLERKVEELEWDNYQLRLAREDLESAREAKLADEERISQLEQRIFDLQQTINRGRL